MRVLGLSVLASLLLVGTAAAQTTQTQLQGQGPVTLGQGFVPYHADVFSNNALQVIAREKAFCSNGAKRIWSDFGQRNQNAIRRETQSEFMQACIDTYNMQYHTGLRVKYGEK